ncbi:MAG: ATP-dependent DNA helicase RecQ [Ginsengibacter sp.]
MVNITVDILKKYWGYDAFRPLQEEIISSVLEKNDTLAILPTGGGKSLCFQVPALSMEGICLVVSPLIALMRDQVENLKKKNIPALLLYSGMSYREVKKTLENAAYGNYKFLYVSPERLRSDLFIEHLPLITVSLIAVDEAHCISQWGYDFRPSYLQIAGLRELMPSVPIIALTASATKKVQDDICDKLLFRANHCRFQQSFERPNLSYSVFSPASKQNKLIEIFKNVKGTGIVYCKSRKRTKEIATHLVLNKISADYYHAGLTTPERNKKQQSWVENETRVIVCTNAFGMGIDKSDVRVVVHYDVPDALENYYQEAGRAGRDQQRAYAVLLYNENELTDLTQQSDTRYPSLATVKKVYKALMNYLQLPAEDGEGLFFDFDINDFVKKFELDIYTTNYVLKVLEEEEILSYSEQFFQPSTVVFKTDKSELREFEKIFPGESVVIKGLLRSYEGIFENPSNINENQLAKFIGKDGDEVRIILNMLNQAGILDYTPQKDKPQLQFLQNRVPTENLIINETDIQKRKLNYERRVSAMISFVHSHTTCRSKLIGNYFNDLAIAACGICDNCINERELVISNAEFENITDMIDKMLIKRSLSMEQVLKGFAPAKKNKVWKVVNYLQGEHKLTIDERGLISRRKVI